MSATQGNTIAALVQRFREAPALPSSERAPPPSLLWWRGGSARPNNLVAKAASTDAAVDAALHAYTSTTPSGSAAEEAQGEDGSSGPGDVISRALAVIRESRAMYESGVLRGLPPTTPLSHQHQPAAPPTAAAPELPLEPHLLAPPTIVRSHPPSRRASLGDSLASDAPSASFSASAAAASAAAASPAAVASLGSPYLHLHGVRLTSAMPLGLAAQIPCLGPSEFLGVNGSFRRRPRAEASQSVLDHSGVEDASGSGSGSALALSYWEDREGQLLGAINQGLDSALASLKSPVFQAPSGEGGGAAGSAAPEASSVPLGPVARRASLAGGGGWREPLAVPAPMATADDLVASAEAIHLEDPEVTLARLRRRLAAVEGESAASLAPYTSIFQAATTAVQLQAQAQQAQQAQQRLPAQHAPSSSSSRGLDASFAPPSPPQHLSQSSLLGQTTIGMLNSTDHSVEEVGGGGRVLLAPAPVMVAVASQTHSVADALVQTSAREDGSSGGWGGGGGGRQGAGAGSGASGGAPHGKSSSHASRSRRASSGAASTPALLQKLRAAIDVAGQGR